MTLANPTTTAAPGLFSVLPMPADIDQLPEPAKGPYYVLAEDDVLLHKQNHWGRYLEPIAKAEALAKAPPAATMWRNEAVLPAELVGMVWHFFRHTWKTQKSEAMVYLTYHKDHGYKAFVPPQTTSQAHVSAALNPEHIARGYKIVGTIHSHCDFGGFHSGTDEADAREHDGLHMTIGHVHEGDPDIAVMFSDGGNFWPTELKEVIDGPLQLVPHPAWWNRYIGHPDAPRPKPWETHAGSGKTTTGRGGFTGNNGKHYQTLADYYDDDDIWAQHMGISTGPQRPTTPADKVTALTKPKTPLTLASYGTLDMAITYAIDHGLWPDELNVEDPGLQAWLNDVRSDIENVSAELASLGINLNVMYQVKERPTP